MAEKDVDLWKWLAKGLWGMLMMMSRLADSPLRPSEEVLNLLERERDRLTDIVQRVRSDVEELSDD